MTRVLRISHSAVVTRWRSRERELSRSGFDVAIACAAVWDEGGGRVRFEEQPGEKAIAVRTLGRHPILFAYDPRPLWRLLAPGAVDLVDIHEEPFSIAAAEVALLAAIRRLSVPLLVYSAQNLDKHYPPPFSWMERVLLRRVAGAHVCNVAAGERLRRRGLRGELAVLPLGVDVESFHPSERAAPTGSLRVGYVGRLAEHKGVGVLVEAIAALGGWQLELVGDGPARPMLEAQVAALGIGDRVRFAGHVGDRGLPDCYRRVDVVVVPSLTTSSWVEQFCRVAVEAMASGVPVVASASGALPEVIGDAGLLVGEGDVAALTAALDRLAGDPALWDELRAKGLARATQFSWEAVAAAQAELYERVLA